MYARSITQFGYNTRVVEVDGRVVGSTVSSSEGESSFFPSNFGMRSLKYETGRGSRTQSHRGQLRRASVSWQQYNSANYKQRLHRSRSFLDHSISTIVVIILLRRLCTEGSHALPFAGISRWRCV